jgi:hypothetical protein
VECAGGDGLGFGGRVWRWRLLGTAGRGAATQGRASSRDSARTADHLHRPENDALWTIAALSKSVEELMALNGIQPGIISARDAASVGVPGRRNPPPRRQRSRRPHESSDPTPVFGTGEICILLSRTPTPNARLDTGDAALRGQSASPHRPIAAGHTTGAEAEVLLRRTPKRRLQHLGRRPQNQPDDGNEYPVRLSPGEISTSSGRRRAPPRGRAGSSRSTVLGIFG